MSIVVITKILQRDDMPSQQLKAALAVLPIWVRTRSFQVDERVDELEALSVEQDKAIRNLNEAIERVAALITGQVIRDATGEEPNDQSPS